MPGGSPHVPPRAYPVQPRPGGRGWILAALSALLVALLITGFVLTKSRRPHGTLIQGPDPTAPPPTTGSVLDADSNGPLLDLPAAIARPSETSPAVLKALVTNVASVTVNGTPATLEPGMLAATMLSVSVTGDSVEVVATGTDGSVVTKSVGLVDPVSASAEARVGVHVGLDDVQNQAAFLPIVQAAAERRVNVIQLDIKEESGRIGYRSTVPLAVETGAVSDAYDPRVLIPQLHQLGLKVVGRIVCILDPVLGQWALTQGDTNLLVQGLDGLPLRNDHGPVAFVNIADPDVRQYLFDLTSEALELGFDEILYDYVRRPEGPEASMVFPGISASPSVEVARFVSDSAELVHGKGGKVGVSVFGISATRPQEIGQDIRLLAPHVDYVAPMLYPNLWGDGEYGVERPWKTPGLIVERALVDFQRAVAGSGAAIVPWLEDYDAGRFEYTEAQVREQIDAARASPTSGWLLWNPRSQYTLSALDPMSTPPTSGGGEASVGSSVPGSTAPAGTGG